MNPVRRVANQISELRPLAAWTLETARALGCPQVTCADADLCVAEAVANIIQHGCRDGARHEIGVELRLDGGALVIRIEDDASPYDPLAASIAEPSTLAEAGPRGRGLLLIRRTADAVRYERRGGLNQLTLRLAIDG